LSIDENIDQLEASKSKHYLVLENNNFDEIQANNVPVIAEMLNSLILTPEDEAIVLKTCGQTPATNNLFSRRNTNKPDMLIGMDYFSHFVQKNPRHRPCRGKKSARADP